jgi:ribosomal protein L17
MADLALRAPTDADRQLVQEIIDRYEARPAGVRRVDFTFGEDWTGAPAVYIDLIVDKSVKPTMDKASELNNFIKLIHDDIIDSKFEFWPYSRTFTE